MKKMDLSRVRGARDQAVGAFTVILEDFLRAAPGALGAAVVDSVGEAVDYAGRLPPFDIKVAAAHFRIILAEAASHGTGRLGSPLQLSIRCRTRGFVVRRLLEGYAIVVVLARGALAISSRALAKVERDVCEEAGWPAPAQTPPVWHSVEVETSARGRRPLRLRTGSEWQRVDVLGTVVGLRRERGYRVRLRSGAELTLVREPFGHWYTDEPACHLDGRPAKDEAPLALWRSSR